jgi:hypothetical protein
MNNDDELDTRRLSGPTHGFDRKGLERVCATGVEFRRGHQNMASCSPDGRMDKLFEIQFNLTRDQRQRFDHNSTGIEVHDA